jgi:hypothetical protein
MDFGEGDGYNVEDLFFWVYFTDSQGQKHNLNINTYIKLKGGVHYEIYLDNKFVTTINGYDITKLNYTITTITPNLTIKPYGNNEGSWILVTMR